MEIHTRKLKDISMNEQLEHLHKWINISKMKTNGYNKSSVIWFSLKPQGNIPVITVKTELTGKPKHTRYRFHNFQIYV